MKAKSMVSFLQTVRLLCAALLSLTAVFAFAAPGWSDPAVDAIATSSVPTVLLPQGTPVQLILQQTLQSGSSKTGDPVTFQVIHSVVADNQTLIPVGAYAYGRVTESKKPGMFGAPGKLAFTCEYIAVPGGKIDLRNNDRSQTGSGSTQSLVDKEVTSEAMSSAMSGGVPALGPGMVLGLMHSGSNVTVSAGQNLTMYVAGDTQVIAGAAAPTTGSAAAPAVTMLVVNGQTLFILKSGEQVTGKLLGYDGAVFQVSTPEGDRSIAASDVALAKPL